MQVPPSSSEWSNKSCLINAMASFLTILYKTSHDTLTSVKYVTHYSQANLNQLKLAERL